METLFAEQRPAEVVRVEKGHGRLERREMRTSTELAGYSTFPGLAQVGEVKTRVVQLKTGEAQEWTHYVVTSLSRQRAGSGQLLRLVRGHWGVENRLFHVKDDSFGEDRQVLGTHRAGLVLSLLRATAITLLRGRCSLWTDKQPLTGRAESVSAHPLTALGRE